MSNDVFKKLKLLFTLNIEEKVEKGKKLVKKASILFSKIYNFFPLVLVLHLFSSRLDTMSENIYNKKPLLN